ncbi:RNA polymerase sigma factor, sigma-70 family [Bellilinea caldifistulae]|nr:RNA polymerase sigma factor, sigma-70 family [Bellilinea caldifistulae]
MISKVVWFDCIKVFPFSSIPVVCFSTISGLKVWVVFCFNRAIEEPESYALHISRYNSVMMEERRTNQEWLANLRASGEIQATAIQDLSEIIRKGLLSGLSRYLANDPARIESLIEEVTQEAVLRVLKYLDTFEGRSQFTTWVYKIAIRLAFSELRKGQWKNVSLEENLEPDDGEIRSVSPKELAEPSFSPEVVTEQREVIRFLWQIVHQGLTRHQRQAFVAVIIRGIPMEVVAEKMGMQRNALYKLLHDARKHLKQHLLDAGYSVEEIFSIFGLEQK